MQEVSNIPHFVPRAFLYSVIRDGIVERATALVSRDISTEPDALAFLRARFPWVKMQGARLITHRGCAGYQHYTGGVLCNADQSPEYVAKVGRCGKYESAPVDALSGLGSQAGGPDYLRHFLIPRTITENTLRRGFAPVEDP